MELSFHKAILRELEVLRGFIIGGQNVNIRYADGTELIEDSEIKLQNLIQNEGKDLLVTRFH